MGAGAGLMKIETVSLIDITPYVNNAKLHPQKQIDQIKASILEFGFNDPIAVDENNVIIEGHGRYMALMQLDETETQIIRLDHLTEAQKKAYILAHNKLTLNSDFDFELLRVEFETLKELDFDLTLTGFEETEIDELFPDEVEVEEDDYELDPPAEPFSRYGDVWILGDHRAMCGSSTKAEDVEKLFNGLEADLVLTDPPYNVNYEGSTGLKIENDNFEDGSIFLQFLIDFQTLAFEYSKPGSPCYIFHADSEGLNFRRAFEESGYNLKQCLIWVKNSLVLGRQDYHWRHEPILYGWKPGAAHVWNVGRSEDTVIDNKEKIDYAAMKKPDLIKLVKAVYNSEDIIDTVIYHDKPSKNDVHPTMKPVELVGRLMRNSSKPKSVVYDAFGGSGSTMIAAEQLKRHCLSMELDPKYVDVIVNRYHQYAQAKGISRYIALIRDGVEFDISETSVLRGSNDE